MLERREAVATLLKNRNDMIVVAGLGSPVYDVYAAGDHDLNFYNWGAMGSAAMVGLGLALSRPDTPVTVFTGDGEMLMGMGAFSTIAQHQPANLSILILDNQQYAETGNQKTATGFGTDLARVAAACGLTDSQTVEDVNAVAPLRDRLHSNMGTCVRVLKIYPGDVPRTVPLRDGVEIKMRFRNTLLGKESAVA